jgi:hypothetical protein
MRLLVSTTKIKENYVNMKLIDKKFAPLGIPAGSDLGKNFRAK